MMFPYWSETLQEVCSAAHAMNQARFPPKLIGAEIWFIRLPQTNVLTPPTNFLWILDTRKVESALVGNSKCILSSLQDMFNFPAVVTATSQQFLSTAPNEVTQNITSIKSRSSNTILTSELSQKHKLRNLGKQSVECHYFHCIIKIKLFWFYYRITCR